MAPKSNAKRETKSRARRALTRERILETGLQLLERSPDTDFSMRALTELTAQDPDRSAVVCDEHSLSRCQLDRRSNRLAKVHAERGGDSGDLVRLCLPNGRDTPARLAVRPCPEASRFSMPIVQCGVHANEPPELWQWCVSRRLHPQ